MKLSSNILMVTLGVGAAGWAFGASVVEGGLRVDPEFEVRLVANEGRNGRPVDLDWDPAGRMWVTLYAPYDRAGKGRCTILVLKDSRGRGGRRTDRFYQGDLRLNGLVFHRSGVIVAAGSEILFLGDADGNGVADKPEVLYSGFSSNGGGEVDLRVVREGLDGWIYGTLNHGAGGPGVVEGRDGRGLGVVAAGVIRFRADGSAIETVSRSRAALGGLDFSWDGELFFSGVRPLTQVVLFEGEMALDRVDDTSTGAVLSFDQEGEGGANASHAAAGCVVYEGGAWPEQFHGSVFVARPGVHAVEERIISVVEGSVVYGATRRTDAVFLAGDASFNPFGLRVGPDGAIYILDEGKDHGRIWRVHHKRSRPSKVPDLEGASSTQLLAALGHPNRWVRWTAQRLLVEQGEADVLPALVGLSLTNRLAYSRVQALWGLHQLNAVDELSISSGITNPHWGVSKNALRILGDRTDLMTTPVEKLLIEQLGSTSERVRLRALSVLAQNSASDPVIEAVTSYARSAKQDWHKSLVSAFARRVPFEFGKQALQASRPEDFSELLPFVVDQLATEERAEELAELVISAAGRSDKNDPLKNGLLRAVNSQLQRGFAPGWSPGLGRALENLVADGNHRLRAVALPLALHFSAGGMPVKGAERALTGLLRELDGDDLSSRRRGDYLTGLLASKQLEERILSRIEPVLGSNASKEVQGVLIDALGEKGGMSAGAVLLNGLSGLDEALQPRAARWLLRHRSWTLALLERISKGDVKPGSLGLMAIERLLHHPDQEVAASAARISDKLFRPIPGGLEILSSRLETLLDVPPDLDEGERTFKANCTMCHRLGSRGADLGPGLDGARNMSARELLTHVIEPNRSVERRYRASDVATKGGEFYYGLIIDESLDALILRDVTGSVRLRREDIAVHRVTDRSYMPEGFMTLGSKSILDLIGYLRGQVPAGYQPLSLASSFTTDSRRGLYHPRVPLLDLERFGVVTVDGEPFQVMDPGEAPGGRNVVMLRGGKGESKRLPQRVEVAAGVAAKEIHVLGGVAGWGFPYGDSDVRAVPAAKMVLNYVGGEQEEIVLHNGVEFADLIGPVTVPGSAAVRGVVGQGQLRMFSIKPRREKVIWTITLESFDNHLAPVFVALTAELLD